MQDRTQAFFVDSGGHLSVAIGIQVQPVTRIFQGKAVRVYVCCCAEKVNATYSDVSTVLLQQPVQ